MENNNIKPNEKECISQCIMKHWSGSDKRDDNRDERYDKCLTNCDICGSA